MAQSGINKVILLGNLGQDPEVRYTAGGVPIANVSIATSNSWKDKNSGETVEQTEWHRIVFFNRLAEIVDQYLILVLRHKSLASLSRAYKYDTVFQLFLVKSLEGQKFIHILIAFSKGQKIQNCKIRRTLRCVSWGPAFFEERCESDHGFGRRTGVVHERVLTHRNDTIKCC